MYVEYKFLPHVFLCLVVFYVLFMQSAEVLWHLQCRGAKFKDFPIKFKTFVFTNSKSLKILQ